MGFQQGLSGLNASARSLDVTGNNVANASTVGFKQSRAEFADVYANSLVGAGNSNVGLGTKVVDVTQQFTQGGVTVTNNPLDVAINGGGFFRMSNAGAVTYTRNGQFQLDKNGYVVSAEGYRLQGYQATSGVIAPIVTDVRLFNPANTSDIPAVATGTNTSAAFQGIQAVINLDSREAKPTTAVFDYSDPTSYNRSTAISIYDSLGNAHTYQMYFVKDPAAVPTPGRWFVYATLTNPAGATNAFVDLTRDANGDGVLTGGEIGGPTTALGSIDFNTSGTIAATTITTQTITAAQLGSPGINAAAMTGATAIPVSFSNSTQFGSGFKVNNLTQDGYTTGSLAGFNVGADGVIVGRYTNGVSQNLAQVTLDSFRNPQGLQPIGNNQWVETADSGAALNQTPGTDGNHGPLQGAATEDSNVDLTQELVNMIIAQRVYQANAQTIKTQDSILQTIVNLR
ncbi:MAG: flagellar hook protein FlgE [Methylophilaceae bacterium]